jgi:MFS transporter, Spinster family, sphingosine-1-phosphate transporter
MRKGKNQSRWLMVVILFLFLLFHQLMWFLVGPITGLFSVTSSVSDRWFDINLPLDVMVAIVFFLVWGYFYDRHSRKRLMSLAGFLWGVSAWLMSFSPTLPTFNMSKTFSGIGRASQPGIFAFIGDIFKPTDRGKILSFLLLSQPLAFMLAMVWEGILVTEIHWRSILILLGAIAFLVSLAIHFSIKETKRGASEPALMNLHMTGTYQFDWDIAKSALRKHSLILVYLFMLIGITPWIVLPTGLLIFLKDIQTLQAADIYLSFLPTLFGITLGYPVGGILGDILFKYSKKGRLYPSLVGLIMACLCLYFALKVPSLQLQGFLLSILLMGFFMAFPWGNMFAAVMDITLPELRGSAFALALLFQTVSSLVSPLIFTYVQSLVGLGNAILWICIGAWLISIFIIILLFFRIPQDVEQLRRHMAYRSHLEARLER